MRVRQGVAVVAVSLLMAGSVAAQEKPRGRACTDSDVIGTLSLVHLKSSIPVHEDDPDFLPHQLWIFTPEGKYMKIGRATPFTEADYDRVPEIMRSQTPSTTYKVSQEKAMLVLYPKEPIRFLFSCFVIESPHKTEQADLRVGDILLDMYTADGKRIVIGHQFRKVRNFGDR